MIRFLKTSILFSLFLLGISSCANDASNNTKECKAEDFKAIFSADISGVENYKFEVDQQSSTESFQLNGLLRFPINMEVIQVGCKNLSQELRFELMDKEDKVPPNIPPQDCAGIIIGLFENIGQLDPSLFTFVDFAQVMKTKYAKFEYNQPVLLQDGFTMQIDKMHSTESTTLFVIIKQESPKD